MISLRITTSSRASRRPFAIAAIAWLAVLATPGSEARAQTCTRGNVSGCRAAGDALASASTPDRPGAFTIYLRGCDGGDEASCEALLASVEAHPELRAGARTFDRTVSRRCQAQSASMCTLLSHDFVDDVGRTRRDARARRAITSACTRGQAAGCTAVAVMDDTGIGRPADPAAARAGFERSCTASDGRACRGLGRMVAAGRGGPADEARARELYLRGCALGHASSCTAHAAAIASSDPAGALPALTRGCEAHDPDACVALGRIHESGGVPGASRAAAAQAYSTACDGGRSAEACGRLGQMRVADGNVAAGEPLLRTSCRAGHARACADLGAVLAGRGDARGAAASNRQACSLGERSACSPGATPNVAAVALSTGAALPTTSASGSSVGTSVSASTTTTVPSTATAAATGSTPPTMTVISSGTPVAVPPSTSGTTMTVVSSGTPVAVPPATSGTSTSSMTVISSGTPAAVPPTTSGTATVSSSGAPPAGVPPTTSVVTVWSPPVVTPPASGTSTPPSGATTPPSSATATPPSGATTPPSSATAPPSSATAPPSSATATASATESAVVTPPPTAALATASVLATDAELVATQRRLEAELVQVREQAARDAAAAERRHAAEVRTLTEAQTRAEADARRFAEEAQRAEAASARATEEATRRRAAEEAAATDRARAEREAEARQQAEHRAEQERTRATEAEAQRVAAAQRATEAEERRAAAEAAATRVAAERAAEAERQREALAAQQRAAAAEIARRDEAARAAEAARVAAEARHAEEARAAEAARRAEAQRRAAEETARAADERRAAEERRTAEAAARAALAAEQRRIAEQQRELEAERARAAAEAARWQAERERAEQEAARAAAEAERRRAAEDSAATDRQRAEREAEARRQAEARAAAERARAEEAQHRAEEATRAEAAARVREAEMTRAREAAEAQHREAMEAAARAAAERTAALQAEVQRRDEATRLAAEAAARREDEARQLAEACRGDEPTRCAPAAEAELALRPNETRAARRLLDRGVEQHDAASTNALARMIEPTDDSRAVELYASACELGTADACTAGAALVGRGRGATLSLEARVGLLVRACEQDDSQACLHAGVAHRDGVGVAADPARAVVFFERSCAGRVAAACAEGAILLPEDADPSRRGRLLAGACAGGNAAACRGAADALATSDAPAAAVAARRGCELGDAGACSAVGDSLALGRGVQTDRAAAFATYAHACTTESSDGCGGVHSLCGVGFLEACEALVAACAGGIEAACVPTLRELTPVATPPVEEDELVAGLSAMRNSGNDAQAVAALRPALRDGATPRVRASLGLALSGTRSFLAAEALLTAALEANGDAYVEAHRPALTMALAHVSRELGWAIVRCDGEVALIGEDAPPPTRCGHPMRLPRGSVVVEIRAPGMRSERRTLNVADETIESDVALQSAVCSQPSQMHVGGEEGGCCWPGQAWDAGACAGTPSCPDGMTNEGATCVAIQDAPSPALAIFHVGVFGGITNIFARNGSAFRPQFSDGTASGSFDLGPRIELRAGGGLSGHLGYELVVGGAMQGTDGWRNCDPTVAGCGIVVATDAYQLDVGVLIGLHTAPVRRAGGFDFHGAIGFRPFARLKLGSSGFAQGPNELTAVTFPLELGVDLHLARWLSLGLVASGDLWLPWKYCGPTPTGRTCSDFGDLDPAISVSGLLGLTFHFGE